jgi:23S rRNA pseudouridine2605 synthase
MDEKKEEPVRLGSYLAGCGITSRRGAGELIGEGRVKVNGKVVTDLSYRVIPGKEEVRVNNKPVLPKKTTTLLYHKPAGVVCSHEDNGNLRSWTKDLPQYKHLRPAGRLDAMSEGLVILTNDGELHYRLTHPRYKVPKVYKVWLRGVLHGGTLSRLTSGKIVLDGKPVNPLRIDVVPSKHRRATVTIWTMEEGRNRQIRRMCTEVGLVVVQLVREKIGPITLRGMAAGSVRVLTDKEVESLVKYMDKVKDGKIASPITQTRKTGPSRASVIKTAQARAKKKTSKGDRGKGVAEAPRRTKKKVRPQKKRPTR